ncbi:MAG: helix-turn-helix domain-containing protein [Bradymonadia bacterium]
MTSEQRVIRMPDDLGEDTPHAWRASDEGVVVSYLNTAGLSRQRVLVCAPMLVYVRSGRKQLERGGQVCVVEAGQVVLLRRGVHMMTEILDEYGPYASTIMCVHMGFLQAFDARNPGIFGVDAANDVWPIIEPEPYLKVLLDALPAQLDALPHDRLVDLKVEEALFAMSSGPARGFWAQAVSESRGDGDARLRDTVTRHAIAGTTVAELATLSGRSVSSFKRDFVRLYGVSPGRWLLQRRLEHAATLLSSHACNVTEACWQAGFSDVSSFIRAFKRQYARTPKQFQMQSAAANPDTGIGG